MQVFVNTVTLAFLSLGFSIIFIFPNSTSIAGKSLKRIIPYVLIMFIIAIPGQLVRGFLYPFYLFWNCLFPALLCAEIIKRKDIKLSLFLLLSSFAVLCFVLYKTSIQLSEDDVIMRSMTSGNNEEEFYTQMKLMGIGGYGIAYSSGMLATFFASFALFKKKSRSNKNLYLFCIFMFGLFAWFSYKAQFTTLIVITIVSIGISLMHYSKKVSWRFFLILLICAIFFVLPYIIQFVIQDNIDNSIGAHLQEVYDRYWGNGVVEDDIRAVYRGECFRFFLNSPIWGQDTTGAVNWIYSHSHSSFMSILLASGIIGVCSYYSSLYTAYSYLVSDNSDLCKKIVFRAQIAYYLMLSYFNSSSAIELYWCLFLIIPLSVNIFNSDILVFRYNNKR